MPHSGDADRAIADFDQSIRIDPEERARLLQPRSGAAHQGRRRARHRRLQPGDPSRSEKRAGLFQSRRRLSRPRRQRPRRWPTSIRRSGSIRRTRRPFTSAARTSTTSATTIAPSPISIRRSTSSRTIRRRSTCAASPTTPKATATAPSPTSTRRSGIDPKFAPALGNRGETYQNKHDFDRAIADFDQAIKVNPNFAAAYFSRAMPSRKKATIRARSRISPAPSTPTRRTRRL